MSRKTIRIFGCDPGKATGFAVVDLFHAPQLKKDPLLQQFRFMVRSAATIPWEGHTKILRTIIQTYTADEDLDFVVANEKYVVTRLTAQSQDTQSIEVSSSLMAILDLLEIPHTFCEQLPSSSKLFMTDARLFEMSGINIRKLDDHTRDALRQAMTWGVAWVQNKVQLTHQIDSQAVPYTPPDVI